ncbi:hypothetical protein OPV22_022663 [Ensete ventricosum]|uniref:Nucleoside-diphosphate kinase n=1 Tax=Ensete ventricosum TaxID=4639 RepID=A0AAV8PEC6_ENSVE|nr:hypothetical protein OPV22_022663 [Ensete ventricosum]
MWVSLHLIHVGSCDGTDPEDSSDKNLIFPGECHPRSSSLVVLFAAAIAEIGADDRPSRLRHLSHNIGESSSLFLDDFYEYRGGGEEEGEVEKSIGRVREKSAEMPPYDCLLLVKPQVRKEALMELVARVGMRVYQRNGLITDVESFGIVQLGWASRSSTAATTR